MINSCMRGKDINFYKKIFENIKANENMFFCLKPEPVYEVMKYKEYIDVKKLRIKKEEDLIIIIKMLNRILRGSIASTFKENKIESSKEEFYQALNFLKYGILKERVEL